MRYKSFRSAFLFTIVLTLALVSGLVGCNATPKSGRIIFYNEATPDNDAVGFSFSLSYGAQVGYPNGVSLHDGGQVDSGFTLPAGNYAINETVPEGWLLTGITINDASGGSFSSGSLATIGLTAGETVVVTFTNTWQNPTASSPTSPAPRPGSIVLMVNSSPYTAPNDFSFTLSYGPQVGYPNGLQLRSGQLFDSGFTLSPGNYAVNEIIPAGWDLASLVINDPTGDSISSGSLATIALAEGETITVTYTNRVVKTGRIILVVQTSPDGVTSDFDFTLSYGAQIGYPNGLKMRDGQLMDSGFTLTTPRTYTINEIIPPGWQVTKIDLNVGNINGGPGVSTLTTVAPPLGNVATIGLNEGETVVVTFHNTRISPATPTPTTPTTTATTTKPPTTPTTTTTTTTTTTAVLNPGLRRELLIHY